MRIPHFEHEIVDGKLTDGYWLQAVDVLGTGRLGLVASGLADGIVSWYENPGWKRHVIAELKQPVAFDVADIDGDGWPDLVVCHDYGESMYAHKPGDGRISWLRNPGPDGLGKHWERRNIGRLMSAHRLRFGRFTAETQQLLALPVVSSTGGPEGVHHPVAVTLYEQPAEVLSVASWPAITVNDSSFTVLHDIDTIQDISSGLTRLVVASSEGLSEFGYDGESRWRVRRFGTGESSQFAVTGFRGSSSVALGSLPSQGTRYAAALEPFHGNTVAVYLPTEGTEPWSRTVLHVYGTPNEAGEGPGHHIVAADFDGDGDDEFLVAMRGPMPWQGVFYYKAVDAGRGVWERKRVSSDSAARIVVADFTGGGLLDFATISYYTPGYYLAENPVISIHRNTGV